MKGTNLHVVYFRTMEDSPEVTMLTVTPDSKKAAEKFAEAKKLEDEWMDGVDEDSGDWAEAVHQKTRYPAAVSPGDALYVVVETCWYEVVNTLIWLFPSRAEAKDYIAKKTAYAKGQHDYLEEVDGDPMHLADDYAMVDYYFEIVKMTIE